MHKCQGMTVDRLITTLHPRVFCRGMAQVSISRVEQLSGLHLQSILDPEDPEGKRRLPALDKKAFKYDEKLNEWYRTQEWFGESAAAELATQESALVDNLLSDEALPPADEEPEFLDFLNPDAKSIDEDDKPPPPPKRSRSEELDMQLLNELGTVAPPPKRVKYELPDETEMGDEIFGMQEECSDVEACEQMDWE